MSKIQLSLQIMLLFSLAAIVEGSLDCQANNCLRALRAPNQLAHAQNFCNTFLHESTTAIDAIPTYALVACTGDVASSVSSACRCILPTVDSTHQVTPTTTLVTLTSADAPKASSNPLDCQPDNCLRQFSQSSAVTSFCATYTAALLSATNNLPGYVSQCSRNPSRISSACSCIVASSRGYTTSDSLIPPPSSTSSIPLVMTSLDCQADNCLRQFSQSPSVTPFCATYTLNVHTVSTNLPQFVSQCSSIPARVSSACSCIVTGSSTSLTVSKTSDDLLQSIRSSTPVSLNNPTTSPTISSNSPVLTILDCQHDNCLRQFLQSPAVTAFCGTYTSALSTAATGLPTFVSQCSSIPSRVSSACSCIMTGFSIPSTMSSSKIKSPLSTLSTSSASTHSIASSSSAALSPSYSTTNCTITTTFQTTVVLSTSVFAAYGRTVTITADDAKAVTVIKPGSTITAPGQVLTVTEPGNTLTIIRSSTVTVTKPANTVTIARTTTSVVTKTVISVSSRSTTVRTTITDCAVCTASIRGYPG